jgi:hypothetical protein
MKGLSKLDIEILLKAKRVLEKRFEVELHHEIDSHVCRLIITVPSLVENNK